MKRKPKKRRERCHDRVEVGTCLDCDAPLLMVALTGPEVQRLVDEIENRKSMALLRRKARRS